MDDDDVARLPAQAEILALKRRIAELEAENERLKLLPCAQESEPGQPGYTQEEARFWHKKADEGLAAQVALANALCEPCREKLLAGARYAEGTCLHCRGEELEAGQAALVRWLQQYCRECREDYKIAGEDPEKEEFGCASCDVPALLADLPAPVKVLLAAKVLADRLIQPACPTRMGSIVEAQEGYRAALAEAKEEADG